MSQRSSGKAVTRTFGDKQGALLGQRHWQIGVASAAVSTGVLALQHDDGDVAS